MPALAQRVICFTVVHFCTAQLAHPLPCTTGTVCLNHSAHTSSPAECHNTCLLLFLNVVQPASLSGISSAAVLKDTATPVSGSKLLLLLDLISRLVASGILDVNHLV